MVSTKSTWKSSGGIDYEAVFDERVKEAKKMEPCDIKLILCGDSAVGKSK
jgi:hypothetical protein